MLERFAQFLLKKRSYAALVALFCGIFPVLLASVSVVIIALVTLRKGEREGFFVLAWGILPFVARAFVAKSYLFFAAAVVAFVLVWGMAILLRRYASWSLLLEVFALLGVAAVLVLHLFPESIGQWWVQHINDYLQVVVKAGYLTKDQAPSQAQVLWVAQFATGVEVLLLLLMASVKLAIARWWEGCAFKMSGLRKEILQTRFNRWVLLLLALLLLAAIIFQSAVFVDAMLPLIGLYIVAGLCALHFWLQGYKYARVALCGFYVVVVIFPYAIVLALLLGLVDSGVNLRARISP